MTRVSNAAAVTLQTWSRTVLAKKEASSRLYEKQMQQSKAKASFFQESGVTAELVVRRFLIVAACVALVGVTTQAAGGPQMLASSTATTMATFDKASLITSGGGIAHVVARSLPSLLYSKAK